MLLKSSSNPALTSWFRQQNPNLLPSPEHDFIHRSFKSTTVSLHSSSPSSDSPKQIARASSESDLLDLSFSKCRNSLSGASCFLSSVAVEEDVEAEEIESRGLLFSSSGLDGAGGKISGVGGGDGCYHHGSDDRDDTDVYYRNMIETNAGNSLILANYAKYLKEVVGNVTKAEEYFSRAILANPNDGVALSMYADLIWETQKDASRARSYFDQAVKASPDDCYVMASYARFLWDDEEDEKHASNSNLVAPGFSQETSPQFPIVTAS